MPCTVIGLSIIHTLDVSLKMGSFTRVGAGTETSLGTLRTVSHCGKLHTQCGEDNVRA